MGLFDVEIRIANQQQSERRPSIDALVDTAAYLCAVPSSVLPDMGVSHFRQRRVRLAESTSRRVVLAEGRVGINGDEATTQVIFNGEGAQPLLGALLQEELKPVVDPSEIRLVPVEAIEHWHRS